jgi:protein SCO1/2
VVVAFLYTRCPDVCPLITENLNAALRRLGPGRSDVRVLAVSVDPKGDTPAAVRRFVRAHRLLPEFRYLTGSSKQLEPVWKAYGVASSPNSLELIDHTAYELLVDKDGAGRVIYDARVRAGAVVHDIRALGG